MSKSIKELALALNNAKIGQEVIKETEKKVGDLRVFGLEERIISGIMEAVSWKLIQDGADNTTDKNLSEVCGLVEIRGSQERTFYDATFDGEPFDHKATKGQNKDNLSAGGACLYVVSGDIDGSNTKKRLNNHYLPHWQDLAKKAIDSKLDKDFSYLVLDKETGLYGTASLRTLSGVSMNQSNFLQASWNENVGHPVQRTTEAWVKWISSYLYSYRGYKSK